MSKQPRDDGNEPIPVLNFKPNGGQKLNISNTSVRSSTFGASTRVITVTVSDDCYFEVGDENVEANTSNSHYILSGFPFDISLGSDNIKANNNKYFAVIGTTGTAYISERI